MLMSPGGVCISSRVSNSRNPGFAQSEDLLVRKLELRLIRHLPNKRLSINEL